MKEKDKNPHRESEPELPGAEFGSLDEWSQFIGPDDAAQLLMGLGSLGASQGLVEQLAATILPQPGAARPGVELSGDAGHFRALVENLPCVVFMAAMAGGANEVYINPYIEKLLGYGREEWLRDPFLWYWRLHPDDREGWNQEFARGLATGGPWQADCRFLAADGRAVWVRGQARIVADDIGRPQYLQGIAFDVTTIKTAEQFECAGREQLERILHALAAEDAVIALRADGHADFISASARRLLGAALEAGTLDELLATATLEARAAMTALSRRCRGERVAPADAVPLTLQLPGAVRRLRAWGRPLPDAAGGFAGCLLFLGDADT